MKLERHPLSAAWPDMAREDFDALVMSIEKNGLRDPIVLFNGMILDGWHRYQACEMAGRPIATTIFDGTPAEAEQLVGDKHTRRSLTATQRVAAIMAMYVWRAKQPDNIRSEAPDNIRTSQAPDNIRIPNAEIAKRAQTSVATVEKVKAALNKSPERAEAMLSGKVSAAKVLADELPANDYKAKYDALVQDFDELKTTISVLETQLEAALAIDTHGHIKALEIEIRKRKAVESQRDELQRAQNEQNKTVRYWKRRSEKAESELGRQVAVAEAEY